MKKILVLGMFLIPFCAIAYEETPLLIDTSAINIDYEENNNELINTSEMKKSSKVENAKEKSQEFKQRRIKLDNKMLQHQRALDYSTKQQNMMLPLF